MEEAFSFPPDYSLHDSEMPLMSLPETVPVALPQYLTVHQLAEALRCCPQTVRNWCKRGLLPPPLVLGRRKRLWDAESVRTALARLQAPGGVAG